MQPWLLPRAGWWRILHKGQVGSRVCFPISDLPRRALKKDFFHTSSQLKCNCMSHTITQPLILRVWQSSAAVVRDKQTVYYDVSMVTGPYYSFVKSLVIQFLIGWY